jgi:8-oxo-dGTP diphosphatase
MIPTKPYAATDLGIFRFLDGKLLVYLVELKIEPFVGRFSLPGTLVLETEDLESAVRRAFREATGQVGAYFEQVYTFSAIDRDPRRRTISTAYMGFPDSPGDPFGPVDKYRRGEWFYVNDTPSLAYDHNEILKVCTERIAAKLNYTNIALLLLPNEFSLVELQSVYEQGLGEGMETRSFRDKVLSLNMIEPTGGERGEESASPVPLYRAVHRELQESPFI